MTSIRCPICKIAVTGDEEMSLTHNLRDHLASTHGLKDLCEIGERSMPQNRELTSPSQDRGPEDWENIKRGAVPSEMEIGEDVEQTILCPFCASRVFGRDGDDLSNKLHDHIGDVHDIRPSGIISRLKF